MMDNFNKDITLTNPLDWIGRGIALDRTFNRHSGQFNVSKSIDKINQSIYIILSTRIGTRFMLPKFGSKLHELLFEPNDFIFADLADLYIREALGEWEPRIVVTDVNILSRSHNNTVPTSITYKLNNSNIVQNYVFPYNPELYDISR